MRKSKPSFFEKVVISSSADCPSIVGQPGMIVGISDEKDIDGKLVYAVWIFGENESYALSSDDFICTGVKLPEDLLYNDYDISKVEVDGSGTGKIIY